MITVRRAATDDVAAIRSVGAATWPSTYGPIRGDAYVRAGLDRYWSEEAVRHGVTDLLTLVAESSEAVVGTAVLGTLEGVPMLWKLYVVPEAQGTGAGRALLAAVLDALPPGTDRLRLDHAEGNDRAHRFYRSQGFEEVARHGEGLDRQVRMERRLA